MFNRQYLKREYILIGATVILLIACYQLAFKKTITAWQINKQLKAQLAQSSDVSIQPGYIQRKNANLDRILDLYRADTINFRSNIITEISSVAEDVNVKLSEVPTQDPTYYNTWFLAQKLSFEGDYFSLMKLFNRLQKTNGIGIIRAAELRVISPTNGSEKVKNPTLKIYFEIKK
jgi:hypothetical protein